MNSADMEGVFRSVSYPLQAGVTRWRRSMGTGMGGGGKGDSADFFPCFFFADFFSCSRFFFSCMIDAARLLFSSALFLYLSVIYSVLGT